MSDTSGDNPVGRENNAAPGDSWDSGPDQPARRRRRRRRFTLLSVLAVLVLIGAPVLTGAAVIVSMLSSIPRVPVAHLDAAVRPAGGPPSAGSGQTTLITGSGAPGEKPGGLIMLLHLNASGKSGGAVSIPPTAIVNIPGHGRDQIENALAYGGPTLLVQTVEQLTRVPVNHYARIDISHIIDVVDTIGGVNVIIPGGATSFGHTFHPGINHLDGVTAIDYVRDPSLSQAGRVLRQQNLVRAVMNKLLRRRMLLDPVAAYKVLDSLTKMLTVDSNFSDTEIAAFAAELGGLSGHNAVFLTAPSITVAGNTYLAPRRSQQLWRAINTDTIWLFAARYPDSVTPPVVP
jgi:LCP family protein required for cell wall assembly